MYSTFGLFASNVKVKLFPTIEDGLHTGQLISRTEHAVKVLFYFVTASITYVHQTIHLIYIPCPVICIAAVTVVVALGI